MHHRKPNTSASLPYLSPMCTALAQHNHELIISKKIFEREVLESKPECSIVESATREYPSCFVFCYQSTRFIETKNFDEMLVGHGPVLVSRNS